MSSCATQRPWGFILFKRNVDNPLQVARLVQDFRETVDDSDAPVLIDQEGGRVQRLGPPHWPVYPAGAVFGALYDRDRAAGLKAARLGARLIAADLADLGITVDCLPLADVPVPAPTPSSVTAPMAPSRTRSRRSRAPSTEGLEQGGVLPVLKHIPGHGRATADSHHGCRWWIRSTRRRWKRPISLHSGRSRTCRWR